MNIYLIRLFLLSSLTQQARQPLPQPHAINDTLLNRNYAPRIPLISPTTPLILGSLSLFSAPPKTPSIP